MPRPISLPEPWLSLAAELERKWIEANPGKKSPGGVLLTAGALHSNPRTVRRWATGERIPRGPALALINQVFREHGFKPPSYP